MAQRQAATKVRLSDRTIKAIEPPSSGVGFVYDTEIPYFGLRTMASGIKSFIYGYRNASGRLHRVTLGRWPDLTATAARRRAREYAAKVADGKDPHEEKQARCRELRLSELVEAYWKAHLSKLRSGHEAARYLRKNLLPFVGGSTKPAEITRRDIIRLIDNKAEGSPIAANRLLTHVKGLFRWAVEKEEIGADPAAGVKRAGPKKEKARKRVLSVEDIRTVWEALPTTKSMTASQRSALRLILITAQRPGEIMGMRWEEINWIDRMWEIPEGRTNSDREHRVPLTRLALAEIEKQGKQETGFVFPSIKNHRFAIMALANAARRNREHFGIERWTPHDLRRTAVTHIPADRFLKSRIMNHDDPNVSAIYDRYEYDDKKRAALNKWDAKLRGIISGEAGKVVSIG